MQTIININNELSKLCGKVNELPQIGWHFVYNDQHYLYVSNKDSNFLRFIIPHLAKKTDYDDQTISKAINETNRKVKFIKVVILDNGSISVNYDHKLIEGDCIEQLVPHMISALDFASHYLMNLILAQEQK